MSKDKYSNGMYKTTSQSQNVTSQSIFRVLVESPFHGLESMGMDFSQITGNCHYDFYFLDYKTVYYVVLNRAGSIVESGYTTR